MLYQTLYETLQLQSALSKVALNELKSSLTSVESSRSDFVLQLSAKRTTPNGILLGQSNQRRELPIFDQIGPLTTYTEDTTRHEVPERILDNRSSRTFVEDSDVDETRVYFVNDIFGIRLNLQRTLAHKRPEFDYAIDWKEETSKKGKRTETWNTSWTREEQVEDARDIIYTKNLQASREKILDRFKLLQEINSESTHNLVNYKHWLVIDEEQMNSVLPCPIYTILSPLDLTQPNQR